MNVSASYGVKDAYESQNLMTVRIWVRLIKEDDNSGRCELLLLSFKEELFRANLNLVNNLFKRIEWRRRRNDNLDKNRFKISSNSFKFMEKIALYSNWADKKNLKVMNENWRLMFDSS